MTWYLPVTVCLVADVCGNFGRAFCSRGECRSRPGIFRVCFTPVWKPEGTPGRHWVSKGAGGKPCVLVRCDCGRSEPFLIRTAALLNTRRPTRSCGCLHLSDVPVGTRFGHQVTISLPRSENRDDGKPNEVLADVAVTAAANAPSW